MSMETLTPPTPPQDTEPPIDPPITDDMADLSPDGPRRVDVAINEDEWRTLTWMMQQAGVNVSALYDQYANKTARGPELDDAFFALVAVGSQLHYATKIAGEQAILRDDKGKEREILVL
jgi:hypothetical protein